jgi:hypothetical protein
MLRGKGAGDAEELPGPMNPPPNEMGGRGAADAEESWSGL